MQKKQRNRKPPKLDEIPLSVGEIREIKPGLFFEDIPVYKKQVLLVTQKPEPVEVLVAYRPRFYTRVKPGKNGLVPSTDPLE